MGRRRTGGVLLRDGAWYARINLTREPKKGDRHPRVESKVHDPDDPKRVITEAYARTYAAKLQALYDAGKVHLGAADVTPARSVTVSKWVEQWVARQTYVTADQDARRVAHYLDGSTLGEMPVARVTPRDVAAWIGHARKTPSGRVKKENERGKPPAERTVRNAYDVLRRALAGAVFAGLLAQDPCAVLPSDVMPRNEDAHPEKRRLYRLSRDEVEALLSDERTPPDRLVLYHVLLLSGARLAEIVAFRWCDIVEMGPLPMLALAEQFDPKKKVRRPTKTRAVHEVPQHPALGSVLAWWRKQWLAWYGREPQPTDAIVPARAQRMRASVGGPRRQPAVWRELQSDLKRAGIAPRRVHDIRHSFVSLCADAGMAAEVASRWTHTPTGASARHLYLVPSWDRQCAEMLKLTVRSGLVDRIRASDSGESSGESPSA